MPIETLPLRTHRTAPVWMLPALVTAIVILAMALLLLLPVPQSSEPAPPVELYGP